jgi:transcriptional regulator with XRE-family HTH domain
MSRPGTGSQAGAQRRIRALAARGWSPAAIERAAGIPAEVTVRALENRRVLSPDAAARIAGAYERLWDKPAPQATEADRQASAAARQCAHSRGWAPPMAWDDDQLDDPDGRPAGGWKPFSGHLRKSADLAEDAQFVREHGGYRLATNTEVAMRLGVTKPQLEKALHRTRQADMNREAG